MANSGFTTVCEEESDDVPEEEGAAVDEED